MNYLGLMLSHISTLVRIRIHLVSAGATTLGLLTTVRSTVESKLAIERQVNLLPIEMVHIIYCNVKRISPFDLAKDLKENPYLLRKRVLQLSNENDGVLDVIRDYHKRNLQTCDCTNELYCRTHASILESEAKNVTDTNNTLHEIDPIMNDLAKEFQESRISEVIRSPSVTSKSKSTQDTHDMATRTCYCPTKTCDCPEDWNYEISIPDMLKLIDQKKAKEMKSNQISKVSTGLQNSSKKEIDFGLMNLHHLQQLATMFKLKPSSSVIKRSFEMKQLIKEAVQDDDSNDLAKRLDYLVSTMRSKHLLESERLDSKQRVDLEKELKDMGIESSQDKPYRLRKKLLDNFIDKFDFNNESNGLEKYMEEEKLNKLKEEDKKIKKLKAEEEKSKEKARIPKEENIIHLSMLAAHQIHQLVTIFNLEPPADVLNSKFDSLGRLGRWIEQEVLHAETDELAVEINFLVKSVNDVCIKEYNRLRFSSKPSIKDLKDQLESIKQFKDLTLHPLEEKEENKDNPGLLMMKLAKNYGQRIDLIELYNNLSSTTEEVKRSEAKKNRLLNW